MIYFDNAATTKMSKEVLNKLIETSENFFANSSSLHKLGFLSEQKILESKNIISDYLNVDKDDIYFTSCGTESNNIAIIGTSKALIKNGKNLITTKIEHPSVKQSFLKLEKDGFNVTYLDVDNKGYINKNQLENAIDRETTLVSIMHINNEIGTIQDIENISHIVKSKNKDTIFHTDAIQSFGKFKINTSNIDLISFSSHKINGPKGVGGLYIKNGIKVEKFIQGSKVQNDIRAGTLNNEGIVSFALATEISYKNLEENYNKVLNIKNKICELKSKKLIEGIFINGDEEKSSPYILSLSFENVKGETLLHFLAEKNIFVSTGSACSSRLKNKDSTIYYVNKNNLENTIRLSFSAQNSIEDAIEFNNAILEIVPKLRMFKKR